MLGERDICYTQELQNTSMHIPDDQYTEEYTVIGAEASKEISQTNQNTDNAIEIQMQTILEKVGGGMGTLVNTVNDMFSKLICKQEEMTNTTMQAFYEQSKTLSKINQTCSQ